jgi:hypothetical protein
VVSEIDVGNSLHADEPNVELKLPDSGSPVTDMATHKDVHLDRAAAVVREIADNNPHTDEAVYQESPKKLANKPPMSIASFDEVFNESPTVNAGRQEEPN